MEAISKQKRKTISKQKRLKIYEKYGGHCAYCGCELEYKDMQIDHIDSVYRFGERKGQEVDTMDNYMPACRMCNFYKSTFTVDEFRNRLGKITGQLEKEFIYRLAKKYGFIQEVPKEVRFYFEELEGTDMKFKENAIKPGMVIHCQREEDAKALRKWISVDERLPDNCKDVIIYRDDGFVGLGFFDQHMNVWRNLEDASKGNVKYWMPLPEPPKWMEAMYR